MSKNKIPNRLAKEKSPYLLQHQYNPVDWFPWGEEAFTKAKNENKPFFLSIGYSTCHWCHVMERESFEDKEVAELLNRDFVSIKVDREERPDVDHLYMAVCQAMTGKGGWPLTVIMTPDKKPFFAGTYYPKHQKYGRIGMTGLIPQIAAKWKEDPQKIIDAGEQIAEETTKRMLSNFEGELSEHSITDAFNMYIEMFNREYGGFGSAPKFPTPHNLSFLLRYAHQKNEPKALGMVDKTLEAMHRGGMYDHIGFGFSRYSTDEKWLIPHFEKMLYDNALLAITYIDAYQLSGKKHYAEIAEQIFTYVLRDMTHTQGGFYSAEDADSEGVEGKFYVWGPQEIKEVLGEQEGELYCKVYDVTEEGNFEGQSIPNLLQSTLEDCAKEHEISLEELKENLEQSRLKLFDHREKRIHPYKDDKILTSWNGLMIVALAKGAMALQKTQYADAACQAIEFIFTHLVRKDGRLLARYRDGDAAYPGYVDDYAFMVWGLIEMYEATFELRYMEQAIRLNQEMLELFWDDEKGGLFFYGHDSEPLFTRMKEIYDGAIPSGNSAAALNLIRLSKFTGSQLLEQKAEEQIKAFAGSVQRYPAGHSLFMTAVQFAYGPTKEIVLSGNPQQPDMKEFIRKVQTEFTPLAIVIVHPDGEAGQSVRKLFPMVEGKGSLEGKAAIYVCENYTCQAPVTDWSEVEIYFSSTMAFQKSGSS